MLTQIVYRAVQCFDLNCHEAYDNVFLPVNIIVAEIVANLLVLSSQRLCR